MTEYHGRITSVDLDYGVRYEKLWILCPINTDYWFDRDSRFYWERIALVEQQIHVEHECFEFVPKTQSKMNEHTLYHKVSMFDSYLQIRRYVEQVIWKI